MLNLDYHSIKNEARYFLDKNRKNMIYTATIIAIMTSLPALFEDTNASILDFLLRILLLTMPHGLVVASLKMVTGQENQVVVKEDSMTGLRRFKELFPTYFLVGLCEFLPAVVLVIVLSLSMGFSIVAMTSVSLDTLATGTIVLYAILILAVLLYAFYITITLSFTGYVIETKGERKIAAIKDSYRMIHGHVWSLIKLFLSYLPWLILSALVDGIIGSVLGFLGPISALLAVIATAFIQAYFFSAEYHIGVAIFFMRIYNHEQGLDQSSEQVVEGEAIDEERSDENA